MNLFSVDETSTDSNEINPVNIIKSLLTINKAYKESIDEKLVSLRKRLEENCKQQNELIIQIENNNHEQYLTKKSKIDVPSNETAKKNETELFKIKLNYFKDRYLSEPESNIDTIRKQKLNIRDCVPQYKSEWTQNHRKILRESVLKDSLRILKLPITTKIAYLDEKLYELMKTHSYSSADLKTIRKQKKEAKNLETKIDRISEHDVLNQIDPAQIDWMKIAKLDLNSTWLANECYLVWTNVFHPNINQEKWKPDEDRQLIDLARKYKEKNWNIIALELNTQRSVFLCIKRYHEKTADKYCKRDWSEEETKELCELAEQHRIGLYVPYNYLCYLNGTRDRNNIYNYHLKVDPNLNHGKWSQAEEQAYEEALQFYNTVYNWQEISEYIGTRTSFQCKDRYELKYCNPSKYINWTREEDKKLLESYKKFENQWVKIAKFVFPHRNDNACLHRYTKLMNWQQQNVWFQKQCSEIKEFILFLCKRSQLDQEPAVYTEDGEEVPKKPVFSQNMGDIIHKIYEKKDLVFEFVRKMREGQLSLTLLREIGIYTHALNLIVNKCQKHQNKSFENIKKIKSRLSTITCRRTLENVKKEPSSINETQPFKKKYIRKISNKNSKNHRTDTSPNQAKKSNHIRNMIGSALSTSENSADPMKSKSLNEQLKICQSISLNLVKNSKMKTNEKPQKISKKKPSKISELLDIEKSSRTSYNNGENKNDPESAIEVAKQTTKKRGRPSNNSRNEPKLKRKKSSTPNFTKKNKVSLSALKEMKLNQLNQINLNQNIQNLLIIPFDSIPDGEKIPCISEQKSLFKFMYSLRKEINNNKYFFKYSIINWNGMYVAIKPFSGHISQDYFSETRLNAIDQALRPVINLLNRN